MLKKNLNELKRLNTNSDCFSVYHVNVIECCKNKYRIANIEFEKEYLPEASRDLKLFYSSTFQYCYPHILLVVGFLCLYSGPYHVDCSSVILLFSN